MEPSLPDSLQQAPAYTNYGSSTQNISTGARTQYNNSTGNENSGLGQICIGLNQIAAPSKLQLQHKGFVANKYQQLTIIKILLSMIQIDLASAPCNPNAPAIKNRLKENKGKLLYKSIHWILQDLQYISQKDRYNACLLWIKGGVGKERL